MDAGFSDRGSIYSGNKMTLSDQKKKYEDKALIAGSLFLLKGCDAIKFIEECASKGYSLLGVEGFSITEKGAFQPEQEHSNDIAESESTDFVSETLDFIKNRSDLDIWYEVVFSESNNM